MNWSDQAILVTGGTGSFGKAFTRIALAELNPRKVIIYSRDELKQHEMRSTAPFDDRRMRYFIGDVRDRQRLCRAMTGVDIVVHAAAMKQVPACEYNPIEAVKTNVDGSTNIIDAAIDLGVKKVLALSTDKAVNPVNLYGATKLVAEKLFVHGNSYVGTGPTRFACTRYGNVMGSRGSVIPVFQSQKASGTVTITDERMTRFWITLESAARFVITCIERMYGGEVFVPKIPSMRVVDLARAIAPECALRVVGIRPGEKVHEVLVSSDEARLAREQSDRYVIEPPIAFWPDQPRAEGRRMEPDTTYASNTNPEWLSVEQLRAMIGEDFDE